MAALTHPDLPGGVGAHAIGEVGHVVWFAQL
jgi:hypothetical protein